MKCTHVSAAQNRSDDHILKPNGPQYAKILNKELPKDVPAEFKIVLFPFRFIS